MAITGERLAGIGRAITMGDNAGARRDDELARQHTALAKEKRDERMELQRELNQREKDRTAANERGGLGSAAQPGAAAVQREWRPRPRQRSQAEEEALLKAAGRYAPSAEKRAQQPEREMSAAEKAMRTQPDAMRRRRKSSNSSARRRPNAKRPGNAKG